MLAYCSDEHTQDSYQHFHHLQYTNVYNDLGKIAESLKFFHPVNPKVFCNLFKIKDKVKVKHPINGLFISTGPCLKAGP